MKFYFILAILLYGSSCFGQSTISGRVTQKTDLGPLVGANLVIKELGLVAVSSSDGTFQFSEISNGSYRMEVSYIGYETVIKEIQLSADIVMDIHMEERAIMTDEVIVSATRANEKTPMTFTLLEKDEIEKQNFGQDIPFILNQLPSSVATSDAGAGIGYTYFRIRGSDATRVNVTINGIPLNDSESQGVFWVDLPDLTSSIENIQVQRGVGTSTNGPGAFGASINIQTTSFRNDPYAEIGTTIGSYGTKRYTFSAGTGLINDRFSFDARLSSIYSDGYVDRAYTDMASYSASAGYYGKSTLIKFNLISGKEQTYQAWWGVPQSRLENDQEGMIAHSLNNGFSPQQTSNLLNAGRTYNYYTYENEIDNYQQDHYQLLFAQDITKQLSFNGAFYHTHGEGYYEQYREDDRFADYGLNNAVIGGDTIVSTDLIRQRWLDNDLFGFNYSFNYDHSQRLELILGGGFSDYTGDHFGEIIWAEISKDIPLSQRFYDNTGFKTDFNTFLKANFELSDRWFLFGDIQYRKVTYQVEGIDIDQRILQEDQSFNFMNPKAGLTYSFSKGENAYISYSVGNREPVRNDFIDAAAGTTPKPESLYNLEVGYKRANTRSAFNANFYHMNYNNQLVLTGELNDVGASVRTNAESSYRMGVEVQYGVHITDKISLNANGMLSRNKIRKFEEVLYDYGINWDEYNEVRKEYANTDISFSPSIITGGSLTYIPLSNLEITWLSKYVGKQFLDNTSNDNRVIDPFFVNDLRLVYSIKPLFMKEIVASFLVNNVFNSLYASNGYTYGYLGGGDEIRENLYYPQAETNFLASFSLKF